MTIDQLREVCEQAARNLAAHGDIPVSIVLPLPDVTHVVSLDAFPDDDDERRAVLSVFAADEVVPREAPCFGFVAEADVEGTDVVVVAYGARRRPAQVVAAPRSAEGLGEFSPPEELAAGALPFLEPLQHAVDLAPAGPGGGDVIG